MRASSAEHYPIPSYEKQPNDTLLLEEAAQSFIDNPDNIAAELHNLRVSLEEKYARALSSKPAETRIRIERKVRSAYRAPIGAIFGDLMLSRLHEIDEKLGLEHYIHDLDRGGGLDYETKWVRANYHGACDTWMAAMCDLLDRAIEHDPAEQTQSEYVVESLARHESKVYEALADAYDQSGVQMTFNWRGCTLLIDTLRNNVEDNAATLDILLAAYVAMADTLQDDLPNAKGITELLFANLEPLTRFASVDKRTLKEIFNSPNGSGMEFPHIGHTNDIDRLRGIFTFEDGILTPTHRSLRDKSWEPAANCAGKLRLKVPGSEDKVEATTLMLATGIYLARHTLFDPRRRLFVNDPIQFFLISAPAASTLQKSYGYCER